ncbi:WXG100 family type VII secretion target [Nocardia sp. CNY236]|uniref:WXG100 family type VII secretion target n=1 Tax=Nocardia sp. CNY236 TaxID=1169152 RepID=UPI0004067A16|nr:WXG100 family type VII secretion target [Nocardia sp. CNY236]
MTEFRVNLAHLDEVTARLRGLSSFVEDSLREVEERIAPLAGSWSGSAADRHAAAHAEWTAAAADIAEALARMRAAAAAAHASYESATAANLAMLGRTRGAR